jgi:hypothetical protein
MNTWVYRISVLRETAPEPSSALRETLHQIGEGELKDWARIKPTDTSAWSSWRRGWAEDEVLGSANVVLDELNSVYDRALDDGLVPGFLPHLCRPPLVVPSERVPVLRAELGALTRDGDGTSALAHFLAAARRAERVGAALSVAVEEAGTD